MNIDANRLAKDFGIFDPSILREEDKAQQRRFPTPKEFVDAAPGVEDFDALGKAYASMYEDYATKTLGMNPGLAKARSLSVQQVFFTDMDTSTFNNTWEGVLNPQKQQAEVQQQQQLEKRQNVSLLDTAIHGYSDMKAAEMLNLNRQYQEAIPKLEQDVKDAGPMTRWFYDATLEDSKKGLQETQDWLAQYEADKKNRAVNPTLEKIQQAKTFGDTWDAFKEHPIDAINYAAASSAIPSALILGNAYLGNRVGGSSSAMTAMGTSSADMEYKSGVMEALSEAGVNVSDRQALDKALKNPELMRKIDLQAGQKAAVVGAFDAASLGVSEILLPSSPIKSTLANAFVVQPVLGAGGEALGSVASGQEIKPGAVVMEALGEIPGGVVESVMMLPKATASLRDKRDTVIDTTTVTPQPIQPTANPLSQFAQQVPQSQAAPQANEQALLPSKAQPHPDDVYYVDQAGRAQYGNPNVPRSFGGDGLTEQAVRGKSIGDLIASGEGDYQSFNRGKAGDAAGEKIDFSQMTVAEVMQRQALPEGNPDRIFTVGKYQAIPETFAEAVQKLGIPADTKVTPALQEYIFSEYLLKDKRPDIRDYITGKSDSLKDAQKAGAMEWAAVADPDTGLSFHGSVGNNKASISSDAFGNSLKSVRQAYANAIAQGSSPDEAWSRAVNSASSNTPLPSVRTSIGFQNTATEPSLQENSQTTSASTPEVKTRSSTPAIDSEPTPTATVSPTLTETNQTIDTARPVANAESVVVNPSPTLDEANRAQAVLDNQPSQIVPSTETSSTPATPNANVNTPDAPNRTVIPSVDIPEVNPSQAVSLQGLPNTVNTTEQSSTANPQNIAAPVTIPPADNTPIAQSELAPVSTVDIGKKGVISDENNQEQAVDFQVVDVADLSLPDDNSSKPKRKGAKRAVDRISRNPIYDLLNTGSPANFDEGAPVLGQDNRVVAGNRRILGLKGAYAAGRASQYKKSLMADLKAQGVDTTAIGQMKAPVLVRRVQGGVAGAQANSAPVATSIPSTASNTTGATGFPSSNGSVRNEQISGSTENQASSNPLYNISPRQVNLTGNDTKLTTAWKLIASQDDAFQLPISTKKTLVDIAGDYDPAIKVELRKENKNQRQWVISVPTSKGFQKATVTEGKGRDKTVYLDISEFSTGSGGRTVYQMIGDYAHNTGKVFIGDPNGLSAIAQIRRTENMLSSALRWGTTDHLQPHELQLKPDSSKVTPLQWKVGNSEFNIDQMLRASMGNLLNQIPELGQIRYNFESQQFEEILPNGRVDTITEADFRELAKSRGARATQAGRTTLKRAVVSASILSGQGQAAWNAVLGNLIRQSGQQLDNPLQGILYGLNPSLDQIVNQVATDKQLSDLAEDALLSVFGESPKNQAIADRLLRQFFFDNFVQSETYPDSRSFVTARMNELRSSGALKAISDQYFSGNTAFKLKDDANRKPISPEKAEASIRRILGDIPFETTIPNEIRSSAGDAAERVKGAFANGKIYIDTSSIGSVAEAEALAIEELVHRGVANLFGSDYDARLMALHEAIGGEVGIRRFISQHKIEMANDYFNQPVTAQMDELLAHIEANQSTLTVRVKRAFQRLIAHLRNAIRKLNTKVLHNVSDSDIVLIARNARNAAKNSVNNPMANPRFGIRPEQESAAITEERMIAEEYSKRTRVPLADRVKRSLYSGKSTLQEQKNTLRRELFKTDSDWWAGVKQWTKRYFYANSTLGRDIADARRSIDQNNAAEHKLVEQDLVLLDALIHNIYGKPSSELTVDEQEQLHQALTGKEVFANSKHQAQLQYFRRRIDELSQKLINEKHREMQMRIDELNDEGRAALNGFATDLLAGNDEITVPPFLAQIARLQRQINTIEGNKGAYLNRSYQAFTDPDWATKVRKKPVFKEAVTFVMEQKAQQLKEDVDSQITKAQASISRIRARVSKLESLQDELSSVDKKLKFRATKLQQLQQVNTAGLNADELAAHQRRINTTTKELTDFNVESVRLKQRINDITSGHFKLDKSETERIAKHQENINKLQLEKESVDQGKHPYLLTRDQAAVKLGDWLNGTAGQRSLLDFASGQGTNEGILKRRKDIPPVLRELLGEFTDPVYNYANTITQVADYVAKQQFQMSLRHFLKSMPNIAFIGSAPESIATKKFPQTAAYSVLNDLLVEEQFMKDLEEFGVLPAIKDPYWLALTRLSTTVKLGKTAVAAPTTLARNFWSAGVSLVGAGHSPFSGASGAWKVIRNSRHRKDWLSGNILLSDKEAVELNQKYIRLGIRGDGASSNELARMFRDLQTAQDAAHAVKERSVGEKFVDWSLATYAFGDDFFKIICFEKDYADLVKAGLNPVEAEQEAARRTRDAMPTYSMIPRALQMLRRFPLAAPFVSFPWEQLRTTKNNLALIYGDYNRAKQTGNAHWKTMAYKRALGQLVANRGVWAIASFSAMVFGMSGDDDDALDHFASDWHKGLLRVYFGADENGVASINFTPIVPSEYIWRAFRIGGQAWSEEGFGSGLYHTLEKLAEPFYQWDISFKGIMNLSLNRDDNGFPIYGKGNSLHDLIANPIDNADNWDKALGYFAKQLGPGIIQNINDFNRALSGSVADANAEDQNWIDNYWNERAASLGGKVSRSGKEFTLVDAVAALLGFRVTYQNMVVLGQQAGQQTKNKVAAYSSEFKDAIGVTNPLSPEFLDSRLELVLANRERAFGKMMDLVQYYRNQGKPNAQILKDLYVDEGVTLSKKELKFLIEGKIPPFEVSKEVMSKALSSVEHLSNPAERFRAKQALAERYRYVVKRAAEMQRQ